jgi:acetate kinase
MPRVLVVNTGSSSIKYQLIDTGGSQGEGERQRAGGWGPQGEGERQRAGGWGSAVRLAGGIVERIGEADATATHGGLVDGQWVERRVAAPVTGHHDGLRSVVGVLEAAGLAGDLAAIGHRVVHGGDRFVAPTLIDDAVVEGIRDQIPLAPLHNPANVAGIEVALQLWPDVPQVAVFDTAFHATLPPHAYRYAVPETWYTQHRVRRYGFHGTSHAYVARRAATLLDRPLEQLRVITAHLGNGASVTAVAGGRSVDTSMGLTPLEGLVMGTRSGDIDPAVIFHLARTAGLTLDQIDAALNTASGLRGLCGDNDLRVVEARAAAGDAAAQLALDVFCHRIRRYIGAFTAVLGGLDALVFTAGIGEHSPVVRAKVCAGLAALGIAVDPTANAASATMIGDAESPVAVLVVPTDEELEIALQALATVTGV